MVDKTFIILTDVDFEIKEWFLLKLQKSEKWLIFQILTKIVFWPNFDTGLRLWLWNQRMVSSKIAILFFQIFTKFAFWPNFDIWPQEDFSFKFLTKSKENFQLLTELNSWTCIPAKRYNRAPNDKILPGHRLQSGLISSGPQHIDIWNPHTLGPWWDATFPQYAHFRGLLRHSY